ncbi:MAG: methionyl-tRNA formyltransferase [Chloroflexi bacterium]|nr:methionyl-tRNA formyltransferase [Chloroflexota bacterium]
MTRIVFMGSPEFAVPSLQAIAESVVGVLTQPDRPAGRGRGLTPCPVKQAADELNLPAIQPERLSEAMDQLRAWAPDVIIVVAFGKILKPDVLDLPKQGCLNVHASLLPQYRGAAPIPAAILAGEVKTGVTLMKMDVGLDTGPMLAQRTAPILPTDSAARLAKRLSFLAADILHDRLSEYLAGTLEEIPQDNSLSSYAPQLKKEDGLLKFTDDAAALDRRVRAMNDWPGAFFHLNDEPFKVIRAHPRLDITTTPGHVIKVDNLPAIGAAEGVLVLDEIQPPGKNAMPAADFLNGNPKFIGTQLG